MTNSMIPYSFTPGTKAKAQEVNANFVALADKIDENNATAMHYNSSATISGDMTFTKPIVSSGMFSVSQGNLTVKNLTNGGSTDAVIAINGDTNKRCGSLRFTNGSSSNTTALAAADENGDIILLSLVNSNGTSWAACPTYTANYADNSTKIVTTAYMANHWVTGRATTTSSASKARPAVVVTNYVNGTSWYRVWSDGWIEQGGFVQDMDQLPELQLGQLAVIDPQPLAIQDRLPLQVAALEVHHFLYVLPQFLGHRVDRRALAVPQVGGANVPDDTAYIFADKLTEILVLVQMGGFQNAEVGIVLARLVAVYDFLPYHIHIGVEALHLHTGYPVHINLNIRQQPDKILVGHHLTQQPVVDPPAFQEGHRFIRQVQLRQRRVQVFPIVGQAQQVVHGHLIEVGQLQQAAVIDFLVVIVLIAAQGGF